MNCKNCHTELSEKDSYCNRCGGKVIRNRLSAKNLFEYISETFLNYDNALVLTFIHLVSKPDLVITSFISGVRKKYINPISFFGLSLTVSGISLFIIKKFYLEYLDFSNLMNGVKGSQEIMSSTSRSILEYNSLFYFLLIPLFALISWIVFLDKKYNFTEHIVIYLYSMSLLSIISVFVAQLILLVVPKHYFMFSMFIYPLMFIYHCFILKRIFKLTTGHLVLRSLIFFGLFFVLYVVISILVFVLMLATGIVNLEDFKPQ